MKKNKTEITNTTTYNTFLSEIKEQIKTSQTRAIGHVNSEMMMLYYNIGKQIHLKKENEGWGRDTLIAKIKQEVHKKEGKLISNFKAILPPSLSQEKDEIAAEYSLRNMSQPIGISEYELTEVLPKEFVSFLPTIEMIESEFTKKLDIKEQ